MKGVFEISGTPRYDDLITERYHFPLAGSARAKSASVHSGFALSPISAALPSSSLSSLIAA